MALYPSEQWLDEYATLLDRSSAMNDVASGWGDGFDGSIHLVIEDLPLAETAVADLPERMLDGIPDVFRSELSDITLAEAPNYIDGQLRSSLPEDTAEMLRQLEENIHDGVLYARLELDGGDSITTEVLSDPETTDAGFTIRGDYATWRQVVEGRPAVSAMLSRDLEVEGNSPRLLQYFALFQLLGDIAADVETTHVFEGESSSRPSEFVIDNAVRQPVVFQRFAHRQASLVGRTLNLF